MSTHDHPSGAGPGTDDSAAVFQETSLIPEKEQPVYICSQLKFIQHSEPGLGASRKHRVLPSELNTELTSNGNAQQFYGSAESELHSKSLVNLRSPSDALPETGEDGSMKLVERQDKIEELEKENQKLKESLEKERSVKFQASSEESVSPLMVQQLKEHLTSMQKKLNDEERKTTELEQVVYLLYTGAKLLPEQTSLVQSVCAKQGTK